MRDLLLGMLFLASIGNAWVGWVDHRRIHKVLAILGALVLVVDLLWG